MHTYMCVFFYGSSMKKYELYANEQMPDKYLVNKFMIHILLYYNNRKFNGKSSN